MKTRSNIRHITPLTIDSQKRLLAYTTAAGVGAFFAGQSAEGQVVESAVLVNGSPMSYPFTVVTPGGAGPYHNYFYLDIDGGGNELNLVPNNWRVTLGGIPSSVNFALNPTSNSYIIPWTAGMYVGPLGNAITPTESKPTYKNFLANSNHGTQTYLFNNFATTGVVGFQITNPTDTSVHFGYMVVQVNQNGPPGAYGDFTTTVMDIFYNQTPNQGLYITQVPEPSSLALLAAGIAGLAVRRLRRQRAQ
jgi:hypothetical protein